MVARQFLHRLQMSLCMILCCWLLDMYILKPTAKWSPYIFTLVQKVKHRVYKIHVFEVKQYFAKTLQVISFKNDVYFLHGRS